MNETTTHKSEVFVLRRLSESFDQFVYDIVRTVIGHPIAQALVALTILAIVARLTYRFANPASRGSGTSDGTAFGMIWGLVLAFAGFGIYSEAQTLATVSGLSTWRIVGAVAAI